MFIVQPLCLPVVHCMVGCQRSRGRKTKICSALFRRALASPTMCRFSLALSVPETPSKCHFRLSPKSFCGARCLRSQINRARGVGSGPIYSAILFQLLLLVRMRLLLAWFRRALVLRSRPCRGLNRPRLWRRSCCGLGPLGSLSRTALRCHLGFGTSMLDRCRLALWPDCSYRPG